MFYWSLPHQITSYYQEPLTREKNMSTTVASALATLGEDFNITLSRNGSFRTDLKPILTQGNSVTDTQIHEHLQSAKEYFEAQGFDVTIRYTSRGRDGSYNRWPVVWANKPQADTSEEMAALKAKLSRSERLIEALAQQAGVTIDDEPEMEEQDSSDDSDEAVY